jgi:cobalamin biosynthesis protein CobD/CbiB
MPTYPKRGRSRWKTIVQWIGARVGASMLVAAGVGILVWTAYRSPQPSPSEMALLALFASAFNVWGGAQFAKIREGRS